MIYRFNHFRLDTETYQLEQDGEAVAIEPLMFELLVFLVERHKRVVSRDELFGEL